MNIKLLYIYLLVFILKGTLVVQAQTMSFSSALAFATSSVPGMGNIEVNKSVIDPVGNTYIVGSFQGTVSFNNIRLTSASTRDVFVAKLNSSGICLWAVRAGGISDNAGNGLAIDANGNTYITGYYRGAATFGRINLANSGASDIFVAKLDASGTFLWAVQAGGNGDDAGTGVACDAAGNTRITGEFNSAQANFGTLTLINNNAGAYDVFVAKIDPSGIFQWSVGAGGAQSDYANCVALDAVGNAYITGSFESRSAQFGTTTLSQVGDRGDVFVAKLTSTGAFIWAIGAGGATNDIGQSIAVDEQGSAHIAGSFLSANATFGGTILPHPNQGTYDAFAATITPGGTWDWAVAGGGLGDDYGNGIALDATGNTYLVGSCSYAADFGRTALLTGGDMDAFVAKIDAAGTYQWAVQAGGSDNDAATGVSSGSKGDLIVTGTIKSQQARFGTLILASNLNTITGFWTHLTISSPLAAVQPQYIQTVKLWPNPVSSGGTIHLTGLTATSPLQILDLLGRVVISVPIPASGTVEITLPTELSSGAYLARAGQQVCRFIIQ